METFSVYCDESCHIEHDGKPYMILGCVYCNEDEVNKISTRIKEIKADHNVKALAEVKWNKVSPLKYDLYKDLVNYFFDEDDLHFRAVIAKKEGLNHNLYHQTHDEWYYKMYFGTLSFIISPKRRYNIYIDIKDTHSSEKIDFLRTVLSNNTYDFSHNTVIRKMQPVRSSEVQIIQLTDILIGALAYENTGLKTSGAKLDLINIIKQRSGYSLTKKTPIQERKFNILKWIPR